MCYLYGVWMNDVDCTHYRLWWPLYWWLFPLNPCRWRWDSSFQEEDEQAAERHSRQTQTPTRASTPSLQTRHCRTCHFFLDTPLYLYYTFTSVSTFISHLPLPCLILPCSSFSFISLPLPPSLSPSCPLSLSLSLIHTAVRSLLLSTAFPPLSVILISHLLLSSLL